MATPAIVPPAGSRSHAPPGPVLAVSFRRASLAFPTIVGSPASRSLSSQPSQEQPSRATRAIPLFAYLGTTVAVIAGFTYILWDDLTYILDERNSSTSIPCAFGAIALLSTVLAPLLIEPLLRRGGRVNPGSA
jgi:hypothetical protein